MQSYELYCFYIRNIRHLYCNVGNIENFMFTNISTENTNQFLNYNLGDEMITTCEQNHST